jgi:hypothetical protein
MVDGVNNGPKTRKPRGLGKRFGPGNPGRPPGSRNRRAVLAERLAEEKFEDVVQAVIRAATLSGDMMACRIILDRLWPVRRGRPVSFPVPDRLDAEGLAEALDGVIRAVGNGELTPEEGQVVTAVLNEKRRFVEVEELEQRLQALEEASGKTGVRSWPQ